MRRRRTVAGPSAVQLPLVRDAAQLALPIGPRLVTAQRAAPRRMAHAIDSGEFPDGRSAGRFRCGACGWDGADEDGDTWRAATPAELRHGIPCPVCAGRGVAQLVTQTEASEDVGDDWVSGVVL